MMNSFSSKIIFWKYITILFLITTGASIIGQKNSELPTDNNEKKTIEEQIEYLISQMTLEEKISMIVGDGRFLTVKDHETVEGGKGIIIEDQRSNLVISRLSIRTTAMSDGPAGLNREPRIEGEKDYQYTTAFPTATCLAAAWNIYKCE